MYETLIRDLDTKINVQKTNLLVCGRENKSKEHTNLRGNQIIKQIEEFIYLGSIMSDDRRNRSEIENVSVKPK